MSTAPEGNIHIGAIWICNQGIHAGVKKDGVVVVVHTQTVGQRPDALLTLVALLVKQLSQLRHFSSVNVEFRFVDGLIPQFRFG